MTIADSRIYWSTKFDWQAYAKLYQDYCSLPDNYYRSTARAILAKVPSIKNQTILDAACGTGIVTEELIRLQPHKIVGIDISADALKRYKSQFTECHIITALQGNLETIDTVLHDSVDGVVLASALWNFRWQEFFPKLGAILKPHGYVALNIPAAYFGEEKNFLSDMAETFAREPDATRKLFSINESELQSVLQSSGFTNVQKCPYTFKMSFDSLKGLFQVFRLRAPFIFFDDALSLVQRQKTSDRVLDNFLDKWSSTGHDEKGYVYVCKMG